MLAVPDYDLVLPDYDLVYPGYDIRAYMVNSIRTGFGKRGEGGRRRGEGGDRDANPFGVGGDPLS
jgi:hypothetical protein